MTTLTLVFLFSFVRLLGVAIALPNLSGASFTGWRFRVAVALVLSVLIAPMCHVTQSLNVASENAVYWLALVNEFMVGAVLGVGVNVLFVGVQVVSQVISTASGLSLGRFVGGGSSAGSASITRFLDYLSLAVFLAIGGHRTVIDVLLTSMREVPLGASTFHVDLVQQLASLMTLSFALGLRAAFPVLVSLLAAIIVLGILSRFLPRFQMFVSAAGINSAVLVGSLLLFMGTIGWSFQEQIPLYLDRLVACLEPASQQIQSENRVSKPSSAMLKP